MTRSRWSCLVSCCLQPASSPSHETSPGQPPGTSPTSRISTQQTTDPIRAQARGQAGWPLPRKSSASSMKSGRAGRPALVSRIRSRATCYAIPGEIVACATHLREPVCASPRRTKRSRSPPARRTHAYRAHRRGAAGRIIKLAEELARHARTLRQQLSAPRQPRPARRDADLADHDRDDHHLAGPLRARGATAAAITQAQKPIAGALRWAAARGDTYGLVSNPMREAEWPPQARGKEPHVFSPRVIEAVRRAILASSSANPERDALFLSLMALTGARPFTALAVRVADLGPKNVSLGRTKSGRGSAERPSGRRSEPRPMS